MIKKIRVIVFLSLILCVVKSFASGCCKAFIHSAGEHKARCVVYSIGSCTISNLTTGFAAVAITHAGVPAFCIGNSIAAGSAGCVACFCMGCAVREYTLMQVSQQQRSENLHYLLLPSQQSMMLSPDSRQERTGFVFSPISDATSTK